MIFFFKLPIFTFYFLCPVMDLKTVLKTVLGFSASGSTVAVYTGDAGSNPNFFIQ